MLKIIGVQKNTVAAKLKICNGILMKFNDETAYDMLVSSYYETESDFTVTVMNQAKELVCYQVHKSCDEPLGIIYDEDSYLVSRSCCNKCIFCFIDQLPKGMRDTLNVKDDDWRMSFACGNYVTFTNLTKIDVERIIKRKYSPMYVSVHATEQKLRNYMIGNPKAKPIMELLKLFSDNDIIMHAQIVVVPGVNDADALKKTLTDLYSLYPKVASVAVVPVGLTKHREGLAQLKPFDATNAPAVIKIVEDFAKTCFDKTEDYFCYCSDEFYLDAEIDIPPYEYYGDFLQIENGVGLVAQFIDDFDYALSVSKSAKKDSFTIITGVSAKPYIDKQIIKVKNKYPNSLIDVIAIENDFFGHTVTVAGLVTGQDIIAQTKNKRLNDVVLLPSVMLREIEDVFLDGLTLEQLKKALNRPIIKCADGYDLVKELCDGDFA